LTCTQSGLTNDEIADMGIGNKKMAWCPVGCKSVLGDIEKLYDGYKMKSPLCKSAIDSGVMDNKGGFI